MKRMMLLALMAVLAVAFVRVAAQEPGDRRGPVVLAEVTGAIGPATARHVAAVIDEAAGRNAELIVLRLETPGGLDASMREIVEDILASPVPVAGYVAPAGGRAASAGTYILYATHLAIMAPGTNIGAATPVQLSGPAAPGGSPESDDGDGDEAGDQGAQPQPGSAMERKAVNDAAALMRSLATMRGRNAEWAEEAVRMGVAVSAQEALDLGAIEIIAGDIDDLLAQADGRTVETAAGVRTLATAGRAVERIEPTLVTRLLSILSNPNVAFILMMIGVYGLIYEFASPGSIGPGVIGAIALVLALYSLNQLPLNYAGLALILLGVGLIVAEVFTPAFGVLGLGGIAAFVIGAAMLIDTDMPEYRVSWPVIGAFGAVTLGFVLIVVRSAVRAHRGKATTGVEGLIGEVAEVLDWSGDSGHVWTQGERWRARGGSGLSKGDSVRVSRVDALTLEVSPIKSTGDGQ